MKENISIVKQLQKSGILRALKTVTLTVLIVFSYSCSDNKDNRDPDKEKAKDPSQQEDSDPFSQKAKSHLNNQDLADGFKDPIIKELQKQIEKLEVNNSEELDAIQKRKISLFKDLYNLYLAYDALETNNETLQENIANQKEVINKCMQLRADDAYLVALYEREIPTIRSVLDNYTLQIDSLNNLH
jgi:hypothetical protein